MSADRIVSQLLAHPAASGFAGGLAGGLLTSKAGRKLGKKALRIGGVAAVGGLAYAAWSRYRDEQGRSRPVPTELVPLSRFVPAGEASRETFGLTLLRAMVAAAHADGKLDGAERRSIFERLSALDLDAAEQAELFAQLDRPVDLNALAEAATTPELASEIYAASLLAIEVDTPAERGYLAMLAARLGLPDALVASLHREAGAPALHPGAEPEPARLAVGA